MDPKLPVMDISSESSTTVEASRSCDTSFVEVMVMENPTFSSVTDMDVKAIQAVEVTDVLQTSVKSNNDSTISSTSVFPNVQFDSESNKEIETKESGLSYSSHDESNTRDVPDVSLDSGSSKESQTIDQRPTEDITNTTKIDAEDTPEKKSNKAEEETDISQDTFLIQDAFIFCPIMESFALNETMVQGIFASESEMNQMECTRSSILNRFTTIAFDNKDAKRSKLQAIEEYLMDVIDNAKEYSSALYVEGIFSYEIDAPIENWFFNSVESLKGSAVDLPLNWMDVSELVHSDKWPLLYSLSMERIEKERLNIPVAAFRFWEQQDFKELLNEVMDKSAFYKFCPKEEKTQGISYLLLEMFKLRRHINVLNMQPEVASRFFNQKWSKPLTGYRIIKYMCKIKSVGIKKMFKELPVLLCENETTTAMNYLILALTA